MEGNGGIIPRTTKLERLKENLVASTIPFTSEEMKKLNMELNEITIWGARYNEQQERLTEK